AVVEVRVHQRRVHWEARTLDGDDGHPLPACLGHRFGRLVDVDRVEHDRPHAGGDRLLDQGVGPLQPVVVTEVGVADTQFQPGLGERVVDRVGHRVDRRVLTVLEWADVENAHEYSFTARACRTGRTTGNACCAPRSPAPLR